MFKRICTHKHRKYKRKLNKIKLLNKRDRKVHWTSRKQAREGRKSLIIFNFKRKNRKISNIIKRNNKNKNSNVYKFIYSHMIL